MSTKHETKSKTTQQPATTPKAKDLPAKKDAKGGIRGTGATEVNHNETLVSDRTR